MRVFVAGATGVIGQYLVPGLTAAGHKVTASARSALELVRKRQMPVVDGGTGIWSFTEVTAAAAAVAAVTRGDPGIYNLVVWAEAFKSGKAA